MSAAPTSLRATAAALAAALALGVVFVGFSVSAQGLGDFLRRNILGNVPYGDEISAIGQAARALGMSSAQADSIGQSVTLSVAEQNNGLHPDQRLGDYVNLVGMTVANASPWADRPIHFAVLNSTEVNAFSAPNGYVLITYGALQLMQDEAELAGVLAHEIGHVTHEHGLVAVRRANLFEAGLTLANTNEDVAQLGQASDFLVRFLTTQAFDQPAEIEADDAAIGFVAEAGYDPDGLARFLERITRGQNGGLFSTHPPTGQRIAQIRQRVAALAGSNSGQRLEARFAFYMGRGGPFVPVPETDTPEETETAPANVEIPADEPLAATSQINEPSAEAGSPILLVSDDIAVTTDAGRNYATVQYAAATATSDLGIVSGPNLKSGFISGSQFPVGTTRVTFEASDSAGNIGSASFTVTVRDEEAPVLIVPADITVDTDSGQNYATVAYAEIIATDNVELLSGPALTAGMPSGSRFPVGSTLVSYEARDAAGNVATARFTVTVRNAARSNMPIINRF